MNNVRYFVHFKGGLYQLIGYARHSETLEELVVYQALYGARELWVRPRKLFFGKVTRDGMTMDRFREVSEEEMQCLLQKQKEII
ncbi:putative uncharacterized protein [Bacteroides sp. CAG:462]|nr:putative uncharacterized protein [Bacteroides sp. CAG:462]